MRKWFNKLLSRSLDVSSKRVAGLASFLVCIALVFINTFSAYRVDYQFYEAMLIFSGGCFSFVMAENIGMKVATKNDPKPEDEVN